MAGITSLYLMYKPLPIPFLGGIMDCDKCKSNNTRLLEDGGFVSFFMCDDCNKLFVYNPFLDRRVHDKSK
jgi:hypothetical protein